jgi:hypothetical protein
MDWFAERCRHYDYDHHNYDHHHNHNHDSRHLDVNDYNAAMTMKKGVGHSSRTVETKRRHDS